MTNPITPPPELIKQWWKEAQAADYMDLPCWVTYVANRAAQWGADQELEACCEWLAGWCRNEYPGGIENLRAARRPKPPSLKEQALEALDQCYQTAHLDTIRRALEALPDD